MRYLAVFWRYAGPVRAVFLWLCAVLLGWFGAVQSGVLAGWYGVAAAACLVLGAAGHLAALWGHRRVRHAHTNNQHAGVQDVQRLASVARRAFSAQHLLLAGSLGLIAVLLGLSQVGLPLSALFIATGAVLVLALLATAVPAERRAHTAGLLFVPPDADVTRLAGDALARLSHPAHVADGLARIAQGQQQSATAREVLDVLRHPSALWPDLSLCPGLSIVAGGRWRVMALRGLWAHALSAGIIAVLLALLTPAHFLPSVPSPLDFLGPPGAAETEKQEQEQENGASEGAEDQAGAEEGQVEQGGQDDDTQGQDGAPSEVGGSDADQQGDGQDGETSDGGQSGDGSQSAQPGDDAAEGDQSGDQGDAPRNRPSEDGQESSEAGSDQGEGAEGTPKEGTEGAGDAPQGDADSGGTETTSDAQQGAAEPGDSDGTEGAQDGGAGAGETEGRDDTQQGEAESGDPADNDGTQQPSDGDSGTGQQPQVAVPGETTDDSGAPSNGQDQQGGEGDTQQGAANANDGSDTETGVQETDGQGNGPVALGEDSEAAGDAQQQVGALGTETPLTPERAVDVPPQSDDTQTLETSPDSDNTTQSGTVGVASDQAQAQQPSGIADGHPFAAAGKAPAAATIPQGELPKYPDSLVPPPPPVQKTPQWIENLQ